MSGLCGLSGSVHRALGAFSSDDNFPPGVHVCVLLPNLMCLFFPAFCVSYRRAAYISRRLHKTPQDGMHFSTSTILSPFYRRLKATSRDESFSQVTRRVVCSLQLRKCTPTLDRHNNVQMPLTFIYAAESPNKLEVHPTSFSSSLNQLNSMCYK